MQFISLLGQLFFDPKIELFGNKKPKFLTKKNLKNLKIKICLLNFFDKKLITLLMTLCMVAGESDRELEQGDLLLGRFFRRFDQHGHITGIHPQLPGGERSSAAGSRRSRPMDRR